MYVINLDIDDDHILCTESAESALDSGWKSLNLTYKVDSPLNIVFTDSVLGRYQVFIVLLYAKYCTDSVLGRYSVFIVLLYAKL